MVRLVRLWEGVVGESGSAAARRGAGRDGSGVAAPVCSRVGAVGRPWQVCGAAAWRPEERCVVTASAGSGCCSLCLAVAAARCACSGSRSKCVLGILTSADAWYHGDGKLLGEGQAPSHLCLVFNWVSCLFLSCSMCLLLVLLVHGVS
jgi:hypothetical protein